MKFRTEKVIDCQEWDKLVSDTYGKPYCFQQQEGCQARGNYYLSVPNRDAEDFENAEIPEEVNHPEMGVSFEAWLARSPEKSIKGSQKRCKHSLTLWWKRNFYPSIEVVANDLHKKGLLEAGNYTICIDW